MSSILKALRKLEEEKSRSREGTPDIARDILKSGPRRKTSPWIAPVLWGGLVLAAGAALILLTVRGEFTSFPAELPEAIDQAARKIPAPAEHESAPPAPKRISVNSGPLFSPSEAANLAEIPSRQTVPEANTALREPVAKADAPKPPEKESAEPLPALRLTGIAFQDGRESRLAVVNDLPVMEGTVIEGVRVVEISRDRVRFDASGRSFEVLLDDPSAK